MRRLTEQRRLALARREQPGEHFHGRRLAAAIRAQEAKDLTAFDGETDAVDGREITESAGQVARHYDRRARAVPARWGGARAPALTGPTREQSDERVLDRRRRGSCLQILG